MTDLHLTDLLVRAQRDARRTYRIYLRRIRTWEASKRNPEHDAFDHRVAKYDVMIWQRRASVAADHSLKLMEIVTR